jgi:hypothetical protein
LAIGRARGVGARAPGRGAAIERRDRCSARRGRRRSLRRHHQHPTPPPNSSDRGCEIRFSHQPDPLQLLVGSAKSRGLGRLPVSTGRSRRAVGGSRPGTPG